jgi:hypothetical protein
VSLKELESGLIRGQIVPFLREKRPFKKSTQKYNAASGIIAGELLTGLQEHHRFGKKSKISKKSYPPARARDLFSNGYIFESNESNDSAQIFD